MNKLFMILPMALILCLAFACQDKAAMAELEQFKAQAALEDNNIDLINRWVEEINKRKSADVIDEFLSTDYIWHLAGEDVSFEEVKKRFGILFSDYPDFNLTAEDVIATSDKVIVRWTVRGTHRETGKKLLLATITIDRVITDKMVEGWEIMQEEGWISAR